MPRLFVYGSLQPGGANAHVLSALGGRWEPATVCGRLEQKGWGAGIGYPGLILDTQGPDVQGQVLSSPALRDAWDELDRFEGNEYKRVLASITLSGGTAVNAYVYVLRRN